jgi:hypothetical protein
MDLLQINERIAELAVRAKDGYYPSSIARYIKDLDVEINKLEASPGVKIELKTRLNKILTLSHTVIAPKLAKNIINYFEDLCKAQDGLNSLIESINFANLDISKLKLNDRDQQRIALLLEAFKVS